MEAIALVEKEVSVTAFKRKPRAVYDYIDVLGNVVIFTRRGKREAAIMSIETYERLIKALSVEERNANEDYVYRRTEKECCTDALGSGTTQDP